MSARMQTDKEDRLRWLSADQKRFFDDNGYLILEGFFTPDQVRTMKAHVDSLWATRGPDCPLVIDYIEDESGTWQGERTYFRDVPAAARDRPYRLIDMHLIDPMVQDFAIDPRMVDILSDLLAAPPIVCNTLLFERSNEQHMHFDTFYMPSPTRNMMCASWTALDPVTENNGPLYYYPKSHLIEPFRFSNGEISAIQTEMPAAMAHMERIIEEYGLVEAKFCPQPGDMLIWHAQLLHGGGQIRDISQTRSSLVTHYWTEHDYPDPSQLVDLGGGRKLFRKTHQHAIGRQDRKAVDAFVERLATPPEHRGAAPPGFDPRNYLLRNIDVFRANADPYTHYFHHGRTEGRVW